MKGKLLWVLAFIAFAILAFLVDHGNTHLGVPDWVWLSVNLTVFLYLLARLVGKPISDSLDARGEEITNQLEEAKNKLTEAERLRTEVSDRLAKVETEVAEMRERSEVQGKAEAEKIDAQAKEEEVRFIRRVDDQIARRQAETREQLARDTAELTAKLTKDLLAKTMTDADQDRVLAASLGALSDLKEKE